MLGSFVFAPLLNCFGTPASLRGRAFMLELPDAFLETCHKCLMSSYNYDERGELNNGEVALTFVIHCSASRCFVTRFSNTDASMEGVTLWIRA